MVQARLSGQDLRQPLLALHAGLLHFAPTIANQVGHAMALADVEGPEAGLAALNALPPQRVATYQPHWAARFHVLRQLAGQAAAAEQA